MFLCCAGQTTSPHKMLDHKSAICPGSSSPSTVTILGQAAARKYRFVQWVKNLSANYRKARESRLECDPLSHRITSLLQPVGRTDGKIGLSVFRKEINPTTLRNAIGCQRTGFGVHGSLMNELLLVHPDPNTWVVGKVRSGSDGEIHNSVQEAFPEFDFGEHQPTACMREWCIDRYGFQYTHRNDRKSFLYTPRRIVGSTDDYRRLIFLNGTYQCPEPVVVRMEQHLVRTELSGKERRILVTRVTPVSYVPCGNLSLLRARLEHTPSHFNPFLHFPVVEAEVRVAEMKRGDNHLFGLRVVGGDNPGTVLGLVGDNNCELIPAARLSDHAWYTSYTGAGVLLSDSRRLLGAATSEAANALLLTWMRTSEEFVAEHKVSGVSFYRAMPIDANGTDVPDDGAGGNPQPQQYPRTAQLETQFMPLDMDISTHGEESDSEFSDDSPLSLDFDSKYAHEVQRQNKRQTETPSQTRDDVVEVVNAKQQRPVPPAVKGNLARINHGPGNRTDAEETKQQPLMVMKESTTVPQVARDAEFKHYVAVPEILKGPSRPPVTHLHLPSFGGKVFVAERCFSNRTTSMANRVVGVRDTEERKSPDINSKPNLKLKVFRNCKVAPKCRNRPSDKVQWLVKQFLYSMKSELKKKGVKSFSEPITNMGVVRSADSKTKVRKSIHGGGLRTPATASSLIFQFQKTEFLTKASDPRRISQMPDETRANCLRYSLPLGKLMKNISFYGFQKPKKVEDRICDMAKSIVTKGGDWCAGLTDLTRMDATISHTIRELIDVPFLQWFTKKQQWPELEQWYRKCYSNRLLDSDRKSGVAVVCDQRATQASGDPFTSLLNSIRVACLAFIAYFSANAGSKMSKAATEKLVAQAYSSLGIYGGDDGITPVRRCHAKFTEGVYARLGLILKLDLRAPPNAEHPGDNLEFLSRIYPAAMVWTGERGSVLNVNRSLTYFDKALGQAHDVEDRSLAKLMSYTHTDLMTPYFGRLFWALGRSIVHNRNSRRQGKFFRRLAKLDFNSRVKEFGYVPALYFDVNHFKGMFRRTYEEETRGKQHTVSKDFIASLIDPDHRAALNLVEDFTIRLENSLKNGELSPVPSPVVPFLSEGRRWLVKIVLPILRDSEPKNAIDVVIDGKSVSAKANKPYILPCVVNSKSEGSSDRQYEFGVDLR